MNRKFALLVLAVLSAVVIDIIVHTTHPAYKAYQKNCEQLTKLVNTKFATAILSLTNSVGGVDGASARSVGATNKTSVNNDWGVVEVSGVYIEEDFVWECGRKYRASDFFRGRKIEQITGDGFFATSPILGNVFYHITNNKNGGSVNDDSRPLSVSH